MQPLMAAEEVLKLFDSCWFEHGIFPIKQPLSDPKPNQIHQNHHKPEESKFSFVPNLRVRSQSDQYLSCKTSFSQGSPSPNTIMLTMKLQTVLSGKEVTKFFSNSVAKQEEIETPIMKRGGEIRRRRKGGSRSLSELEFEELKGFMDLGFVFSKEDKDPSLVSIIPGLQRWGRKINEKYPVSRPYLSESWGVFGRMKVNNPLMDWRNVSALHNEIDIKDHLRIWAQTVASTVK